MKTLECVAFLLLDGDRFLAERRRMDRSLVPGAVAIPGGHMEPGETQIAALHRELDEELAVRTTEAHYFCTLLHRADAIRHLHYYAVPSWQGAIENHEAEALLWIPLDEPERLDLEVDRVAIGEYLRLLP